MYHHPLHHPSPGIHSVFPLNLCPETKKCQNVSLLRFAIAQTQQRGNKFQTVGILHETGGRLRCLYLFLKYTYIFNLISPTLLFLLLFITPNLLSSTSSLAIRSFLILDTHSHGHRHGLFGTLASEFTLIICSKTLDHSVFEPNKVHF